jgi:hypothetical protein
MTKTSRYLDIKRLELLFGALFAVVILLSSASLSSASAAKPSAPTLVSATPGNAKIVLAWTIPSSDGGSPIVGYRVYRGTSSGGETLLVTLGNVLSYTSTGLTNGRTYYFRISALNSVGESAFSNELHAIPVAPVATAISMTGNGTIQVGVIIPIAIALHTIDGRALGGRSVHIDITRPSGTHFVEDLVTDSNGQVVTIDWTPVLAGTYSVVSSFAGDTQYLSTSASTSFTAVTGGQSTSPSAPTIGAATPGDARIILTWTAPSSNGGSAISNYKLYRGTVKGGETLLATLGNVLTYSDTGLTNGRTYYYKVSAVNSIGEGASSNEVSATPTESSIPIKFTVSVSGSNYVVKNAAGTSVYTSSNAASAINKAISSLTSGRTTKEEILLQGTFVLTSSINIASYTVLQSDTATKISTVNGMSGLMVTATGKSNFEIVGGDWNGNRGNRTVRNDNNPLRFTSCTNAIIRDLSVHYGCYDNIEFEESSYITISNVDSGYSNWDNIMMAGCSNCVVDSCHIHDSKEGGCYFYCEADGIVQHVDNDIIRNCLVERTYTSGLSISLRGTEDYGSNGLIEKNTCIDCGTDGMHPGINLGWSGSTAIRYVTNSVVQNNLIYQTSLRKASGGCGDGILIQAKNSKVLNNTIHDIYDASINIRGNGNLIYGNIISNGGKAYAVIQIWDGNSNIISNNVITNAGRNGIYIIKGLTAGCTGNRIVGNVISGIASGWYWIAISDSTDTGNTVSGNTVTGNHLTYDAGHNTFSSNVYK